MASPFTNLSQSRASSDESSFLDVSGENWPSFAASSFSQSQPTQRLFATQPSVHSPSPPSSDDSFTHVRGSKHETPSSSSPRVSSSTLRKDHPQLLANGGYPAHAREATRELERSLQLLELCNRSKGPESTASTVNPLPPFSSPQNLPNIFGPIERPQNNVTPPHSRNVSLSTDNRSFEPMRRQYWNTPTPASHQPQPTQYPPLASAGYFADLASRIPKGQSTYEKVMYAAYHQSLLEKQHAANAADEYYSSPHLSSMFRDRLVLHETENPASFQYQAPKPTWPPPYANAQAMNSQHSFAMPRAQGFRPMQAIAHRNMPSNALSDPLSQAMAGMGALCSKFSTRYHGMHNETNASAENIADAQNCAIWLTNLPPDVTYHELLRLMTGTGRIWCTYINDPDYVSHKTAAAKVVYFAPDSAQRLLAKAWASGLMLRGYAVKAAHNRIKAEAHPIIGKTSRVLIITGTDTFVTEENLAAYFKNLFIFQLDSTKTLIKENGQAVMEWRFGSYRCQAQMGKMALEKDRPEGLLKVEFGDDPCEVGEGYGSYAIALERIQGRGL